MQRVAALALAGVLTGGGAWVAARGTGHRQQPTFRAEVNYVEVDVVVTDASGAFVRGLTVDDFEIVEDGRRQTIEAFSAIDVPLEREDRVLYSDAAVAADIASNETAAQGRVYLLMLDDLQTRPANTTQVRRRAREFVERYVGSNDLVAVLHTSGRADASQEFTANRSLVLEAIDAFAGRGLNSAVRNRMDAFLASQGSGVARAPERDHDARERLTVARNAFVAVRDVADHLASLSGRRKALLLFSEGVDLDGAVRESLGGAFSEMQDARMAMLDAIGAATRANVHVYAIDVTGMDSGAIGADIRTLPSGVGPDALGLTSQALARERTNMQGTLRTISEQSGGIALVNTNNFSDGFTRIVHENSTYYLLGFYPASKPDGKFHELDVSVKRPGLQVRARAGYYASKRTSAPKPDDPLKALLAAPVAAAGLPMRLSAPVFRNTPAEAVVWMSIDVLPGAFRFEESAGAAAEDLLIVYQVLDPEAKVVASSRQDVQMRLRPETRVLVEQRGFRVLIPIDVKPGRYQVRVAGATVNAGRNGSVFTDLIVPDFFTDTLAWSGVSLTSAAALGVPMRPSEPKRARAFPLLPSAVRAFDPADTLAVYAVAYDNDTARPHTVDLTAAIRDDTGRIVFSATEERSSGELGGVGGGYGVRVDIPLANLPRGSYVLTLTAASRGSRAEPATRDIPFTIGIS